MSEHSLEQRRYTVATPMAIQLTDEIDSWIKFASVGGLIHGRPRAGKTRGCRIAREILQERYPKSLILALDLFDTSLDSPRAFWTDMLREVRHEFPKRGDDGDRRERFFQYVHMELEKKKCHQCLLFLDEADRLNETGYKALHDLHNWLANRSFSLCVFLIGKTEELLGARTFFRSRDVHRILARFMAFDVQVFGVRTVAELASILSSYDVGSEYPRDSKISYTQHYLPEFYAQGWRLQSYAADLWTAFLQILEIEGKGKQREEVGMLYICRAIEATLISLQQKPHLAHALNLKQFHKFIELTGFVGSIQNLQKE